MEMSIINIEKQIYNYSKLIHDVYEKHRQSKEDYKKKLKVRKEIHDVLQRNFNLPFDLFMVGSSQTQFSLKSSDMDLCLLIYDAHGKNDKRFMQNRETTIVLLKSIKNIIQTELGPKNDIQLLVNAKVPILKIESSQNFGPIAVDVNINGDISIRNTFLLTFYQEIDNRVAPLVVAVKSWARKNMIDSPFYGTLSSYSLSLMVIHFLQNIDPPILPLMETKNFDRVLFDKIVETGSLQEHLNPLTLEIKKNFIRNNKSLLGKLFYEFIEYYHQKLEFRFRYSIRQYFSPYLSNAFIMIEDPFHHHNTASSVSFSSYATIIETFRKTYLSLKGFTFSAQFFDL